MENHNILNNNQYGFRQKFTTTDAITKFVSDITLSILRFYSCCIP